MHKVGHNPPPLTFPVIPHPDASTHPGNGIGTGRRLLVLVSESEMDTASAARRIWELANAFGSRVQFLGLCADAAQESALRRQLVSLSAMVKDGKISTEVSVEFGSNWVEAVKRNLQAEDMVVCFAEQRAGLTRKPLSQILESNLKATVYVLSGLSEPNAPRSSWVSAAMAWAGSIGIIAGFFWLQVKLTQPPGDWSHTALVYLSIFLEVGLIWGWNSLFS